MIYLRDGGDNPFNYKLVKEKNGGRTNDILGDMKLTYTDEGVIITYKPLNKDKRLELEDIKHLLKHYIDTHGVVYLNSKYIDFDMLKYTIVDVTKHFGATEEHIIIDGKS